MENGRKKMINADRKYYEYKKNDDYVETAPKPQGINTLRNADVKSRNQYINEYENYNKGFSGDDLNYDGEDELYADDFREPKKENYLKSELIGLAIIFVLVISVFLFARKNFTGEKLGGSNNSSNSQTQNSETVSKPAENNTTPENDKLEYIKANPDLYPEGMISLLEKNPELLDFAYNYPSTTHEEKEINLANEASAGVLPALMQWDARWGYKTYAEKPLGISDGGPTSLSMVALYLTKDSKYTPAMVADYAATNNKCSASEGTSKSLFSDNAADFGMSVVELPKDEKTVTALLSSGIPIICAVGAGDFTEGNGYIVLSGYEGGIKLHDPMSQANSDKTWDYAGLSSQINNMWAYFGPTLMEASFKVNGTTVNVRNQASQSGEVVKKVNTGEVIKIKSLKRDGTLIWGELEDGNWICMNYVTK